MTRMLDIDRMVLGPLGTNVYIVFNTETKEAVIIDPAAKPNEIMVELENNKLTPKAILLTHGHFDHILAVNELVEKYHIPVYASAEDKWLLDNPNFYGHDFSQHAVKNYEKITFDEKELIGFKWKVIRTPGHSKGSVCYYIEDEKVMFSGDTLFEGTYGRTDFDTGSMEDMLESINKKLFILPDDIDVFPGHGGETILGREKIYNAIKEIN